MIERQHLRIVAAIASKGTLTGAAESLHVTQSALSHSMKKLENEFGILLWRRDGRLLKLTQAGETLLNLAERILPQITHTENIFQNMASGRQGVLRIGMECHPCYQWLLKVVEPFLQAYPLVDVDVRQQFKFGGLAALHEYDIDLLLTPDPLFLKSVQYEPVFPYEQVLVTAKSHPLANLPWIPPEALAEETLITYPVEPSRLDIFAHFLTPAGCGVKRHKTIETTEILLQMVQAKRGVTALPEWLIRDLDQSEKLSCTRLGERGIAKTLYLGYRPNDAAPEYLEAFISQAKRVGQDTVTG